MANKTEIIIDGNSKGAILAINGVKSELNMLGKEIGGPFGASMTSLSKHLTFAGIAAGIGGLAALTKQAINSADELYNMSQRVGVSVESLSVLKYAADLSELSLEQMEIGLKKLSTALYDVAHGQSGKVAVAFNEIGVEALDTNGKVRLTEDVLLDIADKFSKMSDGANKSALAVALFGKSGLQVIPFLNQGKEGIKALTNEAEQLGLKMSTEFARNAESFNDNLTTMGYVAQGVGLSIAQELLPFLFSLSESLKSYAKETNAAGNAGAGFAEILKGIVTGLGGVYAGATIAGDALGTFYGAVATLISTGSFSQAANVVSLGFNTIEKDALKFGDAFDALWKNNTKSYQNYINSIGDKETNSLSNQLKTVKQLKDEYAKLIETKAMGQPQSKALGAGEVNPMPDSTPMFDMPLVEENPFDVVANYATNFFDMYDERASMMRQNTSDMFGNMGNAASAFYQMSGQKSKEWFAVQKGFNIAQAIMNTYEGATKALGQGGFFGIAMAATVIAAGLANVAMIASQQPGTGSSGSGSGGSASIPSSSGSQVSNNNSNNSTKQYTINFYGDQGDKDKDRLARDLIEALNKAQDDGLLLN